MSVLRCCLEAQPASQGRCLSARADDDVRMLRARGLAESRTHSTHRQHGTACRTNTMRVVRGGSRRCCVDHYLVHQEANWNVEHLCKFSCWAFHLSPHGQERRSGAVRVRPLWRMAQQTPDTTTPSWRQRLGPRESVFVCQRPPEVQQEPGEEGYQCHRQFSSFKLDAHSPHQPFSRIQLSDGSGCGALPCRCKLTNGSRFPGCTVQTSF